nr:uncharacterized protein LOC113722600 [Coffea arabica]
MRQERVFSSSKWRYVWAEYPELVLDKQFYTEMVRSKSPILFQSEYGNIVNGILFQHLGPILKFVLDIPELQSTRYSNIDQCAPKGLDGCRKLTHLFLTSVAFEFSVLNFPQLLQLTLQSCSGIHLLSISAPSLKGLILVGNDGLDLSNYITCKDLVVACIALSKEVEHHKLEKEITLTKLLGCWPKLKRLLFDESFFQHLAAGDIPHKLPVDLLNSLSNRIKSDEKTLQHLKEPGLMKESLKGLKTVIMRNFKGSTAELLLVKLLLACSRHLKECVFKRTKALTQLKG